jgi:hypothetical protein
MAKLRKGLVVGKDFKPPPGSEYEDWCYLVVDISEDELVSVRLDRSQVDKAILGDRVQFRQPRNPDKATRWVRRV